MGGGNVSQDQTSIICIDLKSFYASVECVERGLNPFKTNLVVADPTRSKSTICLAITPAMKALGIKNRCRIHEIPDCVKYITAMPRMQLYMDYSAKIYGIYLRYVSKEDIHVYSVDECLFTTSISEVCFYTDDIDFVYKTLIENHVECLSEPQYFDFRADGFGESRAFYFRDPDGIILEMMQPL